MVLKIVASATAGFCSLVGVWFVLLVLETQMGINLYLEGPVAAVCIGVPLVVTGITFKKYKAKPTLAEKIAANKMKIMKAEQEARLKELEK
ncbi:MAG: hypothetical protein HUN04_15895 [Desulfobacter sp.]|nr:MAG: hypothetical protein HUN04_15895 [Desulfobacter sp.]